MNTETTHVPEIVELPEQTAAVVRGRVPADQLPGFFDKAYAEVFTVLKEQGIGPVGPPFGRYLSMSDTVEVEAGVGTERAIEPSGEVQPVVLPGGRAARLVHEGPYERLGESWRELEAWITALGEKPGGAPYEEYVSEPDPATDPERLHTVIVWPLA